MSEKLRNWAGNVTYAARAVHAPRRIDEVRAIVRNARRVRAVGTRHSFSAVADTDGDLVSMRHLNGVVNIDTVARTITVEGGATYRDVGPALHEAGFALANLASLPHISIAGACATGTHGSGNRNAVLAAAVSALTLVTADGELATLRRGDPGFEGVPVNLGALGIVAELTLDIVPRFEARQEVWLDLPFAAFTANFDSIMSSAYSVSAFTSWRSERIDQLWRKSLGDAPPLARDLPGARWTDRPVHLVAAPDAPEPTDLLGVNSPAYQRLPHYPHDAELPVTGAELQSEYYVGYEDAPAALRALHAIRDRLAPSLLITEIRTVAADELWLSGCYRRRSVGIHFAFRPDLPALLAVLPEIEAVLAPFAPRPHWGKLFTMPEAEVRACYPKRDAFVSLAARLDPGEKFLNGFFASHVLGRR